MFNITLARQQAQIEVIRSGQKVAWKKAGVQKQGGGFLREQHSVPEILSILKLNLSTKISERPGAQAVMVEAAYEHWHVTSLQLCGTVLSLIASVGESSLSLY